MGYEKKKSKKDNNGRHWNLKTLSCEITIGSSYPRMSDISMSSTADDNRFLMSNYNCTVIKWTRLHITEYCWSNAFLVSLCIRFCSSSKPNQATPCIDCIGMSKLNYYMILGTVPSWPNDQIPKSEGSEIKFNGLIKWSRL